MARTIPQVLLGPKHSVRPIENIPTNPHGGVLWRKYTYIFRVQQLGDRIWGFTLALVHKIQVDRPGIDALHIGVVHDVAVALRLEDLDDVGVGVP